uniref:(northern house mosquito) hypothetical protein n=1 Tax=Culex pipiens TaxID=7175 RepID=A0A8D8G7Y8_CULPI
MPHWPFSEPIRPPKKGPVWTSISDACGRHWVAWAENPLVGITIVCPWLIAFPSNSSSSPAPCSDRPLAFWSPRLTCGFTWNEYLVAIRRFFTVIVYCLLFPLSSESSVRVLDRHRCGPQFCISQ